MKHILFTVVSLLILAGCNDKETKKTDSTPPTQTRSPENNQEDKGNQTTSLDANKTQNIDSVDKKEENIANQAIQNTDEQPQLNKLPVSENQESENNTPIQYILGNGKSVYFERFYDYSSAVANPENPFEAWIPDFKGDQLHRINTIATYEFLRLTHNQGSLVLNWKDENLTKAMSSVLDKIKQQVNKTLGDLDLLIVLDNTRSFERTRKLRALEKALSSIEREFMLFQSSGRKLRIALASFSDEGQGRLIGNSSGEFILDSSETYAKRVSEFIEQFSETSNSALDQSFLYPILKEGVETFFDDSNTTQNKSVIIFIDEATHNAQNSRPKNTNPITLEKLISKYNVENSKIGPVDWYWTVEGDSNAISQFTEVKRRLDERNDLIKELVEDQDWFRAQKSINYHVILTRR
ncbi:MAG: VWA domain-containing protein [Halobacteriovoraceae bacterium]|nr:VWA domain-containing protein [Halobacteriovoraceae bacterium]